MGPVRSFLNGLDNAKQMEAAAKENIHIGLQLLDKRFSLYETQLNFPIGEVQKMPGKYLVTFSKKKCISVQKNSSHIQNQISQIVSSFCKGDIGKSVENILTGSLNAILGTYSAGYNESQDYVVVTNQIGGLFRIDYLVVQQKIVAKGLQKHVTDIFGSYLIVSSIDISQVEDENALKVIVARQFPEYPLSLKFLIIQLIKGKDLGNEQMELLDEAHKEKNKMILFRAPPLNIALEREKHNEDSD